MVLENHLTALNSW